MAVIRKIRNYSGLLIAVIGIGLAAFVLGDFLGHGPMRQQRFDLGKVDGTAIPYQQFEMRVQQQVENWQNQTGASAGPDEVFQIRQQVWNEMVKEILLDEKLDALGVEVSSEELFNMIHGPDPHPILVQSFSDPVTGAYDPQQVIDFLRNFDMLDPTVRNQWVMLEQFIKKDRRESKYHQMISNAYVVPSAMAEMDFLHRNKTADIRFAFKPHAGIDDEAVNITNRELRRVYDENKQRFRQEASRHIKYVSLPVFPSDEDRENTLNEISLLKEEITDVPNIESFVNSMSDRRFDPTYHAEGTLSPQIDPEIFDVPVGTVLGPYMEDNAYVIAMLNDIQMRPDSMRASHILIAYQGSAAAIQETLRTYAEAQEKADSLLSLVRNNPARFPMLAAEVSDDPAAAMNQGDLEWFRDGAMVPEFNEAVVETPVDNFVTVETDFGFHVIHVTSKSPLSKKVQVAKIVRNIEPGSRTFQDVYARISAFASALRDKKDFDAAAEEADLTVREAERVGKMDRTLPGIDQGRQIVQWAFLDNTRKGDYSRIFEAENTFVVATVTRKQEEGTPTLDAIRPEIMEIALKEKKQEMIAEEMAQLMTNGSLEEVAGQMDLEILEATDITFNSRNLPGAGPEPGVIGTIFAGKETATLGPIKGNNGVFVVEVVRMDDVPAPEDLTQAKRPLRDAFRNRVPTQAFEAIRDNADIEDNRAMFF